MNKGKVRTVFRKTGIVLLLAFGCTITAELRADDSVTPPAGLAGWWRAEGNAVDSRGGSNNGTLVGNTTFVAGKVGQAFSITDNTGGISVPQSANLTGDAQRSLTIEAWINPSTISIARPIVEYCNANSLASVALYHSRTIGNSNAPGSLYGSFRFQANGQLFELATSTNRVPANQWTHVAFVINNNVPRSVVLYINGAWSTYSTNLNSPLAANTFVPVSIGYCRVDSLEAYAGRRYAGQLDEVSIYNRALTAAEILAIYNAGTNGKSIDTVPPSVIQQPLSRTNTFGTTATFSAISSGGIPMTYRWQKDGVDMADGGSVSGSATTILVITNVQDSDAASYTLAMTNGYGSTNSAPAVLTVLDPPVITVQPASCSAVAGGIATFSVTAFGAPPLSYQWRKGGTNLSDGGVVSGAQTRLLTLGGVSAADVDTYDVVITNSSGATNSVGVSLSILPALVVSWGDNSWAPTNPPADLTNAIAVSAGWHHTLALRSDGTVAVWGYGNAQDPWMPAPAGLSNVVAVSAGFYHNLALKDDGTVVSWHATNTGTFPDYGQWIIPNGLSNVVAITAGYRNSMALKSDGTVVEWGYNLYGQNNVPSYVTNVVAISGANDFSIALKADGSVVGWGASYSNLLVIPQLTNAVAISAARFHGLALTADGHVYAWGVNNYGEGAVPPGLSNVVAIAAGEVFNVAMKSDGTVVAWGDNVHSETNVPINASNAVGISAGIYHAVAALVNNGTPTILKQPLSLKTAKGVTGTFSVSAVGAPQLGYRWRKNGTNMIDGGNVSGSATPVLKISNVQSNDWAAYTVSVSNYTGSTVSSPAVLEPADPAIDVDPASLTNSVGSAATFNVSASGATALSFQWLKNGLTLTNGGNVSGVTTSNLTLTNLSFGDSGGFSVVVTNLSGSATSIVANLSVIVPRPNLSFSAQSNGSYNLHFIGVPNWTYRVQYATNVGNPAWQDIATNTTDALGNFSLDVNYAPPRFYRAIWP